MTDALDRMRAESDWLKAELTLRAEIDRLQKEIERLRDDYANRLLDICADSRRFMDERDAAIKQRDEARRELCAARRELCRNEAIIRLQRNRVHRDSEDVVGLAKEIAVERGWDCFKYKP